MDFGSRSPQELVARYEKALVCFAWVNIVVLLLSTILIIWSDDIWRKIFGSLAIVCLCNMGIALALIAEMRLLRFDGRGFEEEGFPI